MARNRMKTAARFLARLVAVATLLGAGGLLAHDGSQAASPQAIQAPVLKWSLGGCYSSWCETGWYSSPAVADLDGDGTMEVLGAAYTLFTLNGEDGTEQWHEDPPGSSARTWPGVVVADIDGDADLEVVTAHGGGYVRVLDHGGTEVWTRRPTSSELRGLSVYDLDGDGTLEIVVTGAVGSETNTWVYEHSGALRSGWPQLNNDSGYAWGVFNDNAAVADIDGDGLGEIVVPSDVHYICTYEANGVQIQAHPMYGDKAWGKVGIHVDHAVDLRGYANCDYPPHPPLEPRPNFAHSPATVADVNRDGVPEIVVVGNNYDCRTRPDYTDLYEMAYIFNDDRSRWSDDGFDWVETPDPDGQAAPRSEDWHVIESNQPNPVVVDLDGDGFQEILFSSYDGRVHAFWLDKSEHGSWPYRVFQPGEGLLRFASEPAVADLDNDGLAEVIFGSWVQKGTYRTGKLHILDYQGNVVHEIDLPAAYDSSDWNGALPAPTLADIDGDPDLEVVLNTAHSGIVAYDLPGTADARILWGTGRGNYHRTGSQLQGYLGGSRLGVHPILPGPGDTLNYTLILRNPGPALETVRVTDTLAPEVEYQGNLWASAGQYHEADGVIFWAGTVLAGVPVTITFGATVDMGIVTPHLIPNIAWLDDGLGNVIKRSAPAMANGFAIYVPTIGRQARP